VRGRTALAFSGEVIGNLGRRTAVLDCCQRVPIGRLQTQALDPAVIPIQG
jgi:hypothetical protein